MPDAVPSRSPWVEQLAPLGDPRPLLHDTDTDVAVVGAGIAGAATAFFVLRHTDRRVLLVERGRIGAGATGHNAGQMATYFERPLTSLVEEYGFELAIAAQRELESAWEHVDTILDALGDDGASVSVERFDGCMGMFTLDHVVTHLQHSEFRRRHGLAVPRCLVSTEAAFLDEIPEEYDGLYEPVPHHRIRELLGTTAARYCAVLIEPKGCGNGALLVQAIIAHLERTVPERFRFVDHTRIDDVVLGRDGAVLHAGAHSITAERVVLCTNGFTDHHIVNDVGPAIDVREHHHVHGTVGFMAGFLEPGARSPLGNSFIRNERVGGDIPYVYVTRRNWGGNDGPTLVCFGGPETAMESSEYDPDAGYPPAVISEVDDDILPIAYPSRPAGMPFDFAWHGLMAYTENRVRLIGAEPRNPVLVYNLGCNGVGFMPSIMGGHRVARLLSGEQLPPSMFDPPLSSSRG